MSGGVHPIVTSFVSAASPPHAPPPSSSSPQALTLRQETATITSRILRTCTSPLAGGRAAGRASPSYAPPRGEPVATVSEEISSVQRLDGRFFRQGGQASEHRVPRPLGVLGLIRRRRPLERHRRVAADLRQRHDQELR